MKEERIFLAGRSTDVKALVHLNNKQTNKQTNRGEVVGSSTVSAAWLGTAGEWHGVRLRQTEARLHRALSPGA